MSDGNRYNNPERNRVDFLIQDLMRRVRALEAGAGLGNSSITKGILRIGGGATIGQIIVEGGLEEAILRLVQGTIGLRVAGSEEGSITAGTNEDGHALIQLLPPYLSGNEFDNRLTIEGGSPEARGGLFANMQGEVQLRSREGTIFVLANTSLASIYSHGLFLFAADDAGAPIADPDLGASGGTSKGTYTSYVTTSNAANCHVFFDSGRIARSTSAAKYKQDIEDLPIESAEVLALKPRTWRDKGEVEQAPDTNNWHVGLIAEEVVEAGLEEFVDFDENGDPANVSYDRLVIALLAVIKDQQKRLDALDGGGTNAVDSRASGRERVSRPRKPRRRPVDSRKKELPSPRKDRTPQKSPLGGNNDNST